MHIAWRVGNEGGRSGRGGFNLASTQKKPVVACLTSASGTTRKDRFHRMSPFLELAVPAAEENDGGDGAQQKQQEEESTLDAVGSQQNEESRGDHGAGEAGGRAARG